MSATAHRPSRTRQPTTTGWRAAAGWTGRPRNTTTGRREKGYAEPGRPAVRRAFRTTLVLQDPVGQEDHDTDHRRRGPGGVAVEPAEMGDDLHAALFGRRGTRPVRGGRD